MYLIFKKFDIEYPKLKKGRKSKANVQNMINAILDYTKKHRVGYQRMTDFLLRMGYDVTENQVKRIYEVEGLYMFKKEYNPDNVHDLRFVVPFVNQIWHTDLHYLTREGDDQKYLISFIDDRSRKIIYIEVLDNKTAFVII